MNIFGLYIAKEPAGVISHDPCWVCFYGSWIHTGDSLIGLLWNVATEWKHNRHLAG